MRPQYRIVADERLAGQADRVDATGRLVVGAVVYPPEGEDREGCQKRRGHEPVAGHPSRQAETEKVADEEIYPQHPLALVVGDRRVVQRKDELIGEGHFHRATGKVQPGLVVGELDLPPDDEPLRRLAEHGEALAKAAESQGGKPSGEISRQPQIEDEDSADVSLDRVRNVVGQVGEDVQRSETVAPDQHRPHPPDQKSGAAPRFHRVPVDTGGGDWGDAEGVLFLALRIRFNQHRGAGEVDPRLRALRRRAVRWSAVVADQVSGDLHAAALPNIDAADGPCRLLAVALDPVVVDLEVVDVAEDDTPGRQRRIRFLAASGDALDDLVADDLKTHHDAARDPIRVDEAADDAVLQRVPDAVSPDLDLVGRGTAADLDRIAVRAEQIVVFDANRVRFFTDAERPLADAVSGDIDDIAPQVQAAARPDRAILDRQIGYPFSLDRGTRALVP